MKEAVHLALDGNSDMRLAREQQKEVKGEAWQVLSGILPHLTATASQYRETKNLAATGQGVGSVGPYQSFDARLGVAQTLFDFRTMALYQAATTEKQKSKWKVALAREITAMKASFAYLNAVTAEALLQAAISDMKLAKSQMTLVSDRHREGLETVLEITRARVLLSRAELAVTHAENQKNKALLSLKRVLGLPMQQNVSLDDTLTTHAEEIPDLETSLALAKKQRFELRLAEEQVEESEHRVRAAAGRHLPVVSALGDYGYSGNTPSQNSEKTYRFGVQMQLPIFDGGQTVGEIQSMSSQKRQAEILLQDLQNQIEEEVTSAIDAIAAANLSVKTSTQIENLANEEYRQVQNTFVAGIVNGSDLILAHESWQRARQDNIAALAEYSVARVAFLFALGQMERLK